jgi:phytoene dehydrogenase-like protein
MGTHAIVIGAGHNGLVAAVKLAAAGVDVTVYEHAPAIGGATSTIEGPLPGFRNDHCAGFVPAAAVSPAMRELDLERDGVEWINPPLVLAHPFDDGSAIALHRDVDATAASLGAAGDGWARAMDRMLPNATRFAHSIFSPLPPLRAPARMAFSLGRDNAEWIRRLTGSVEALGFDLFEGARRPTAWLCGSAQHSGLPPTAAGSGAFGLLLQLLGHSHGWPFPRGGMQTVTDALAGRARGHGATIHCGAGVERILVVRGRAVGVRLLDGQDVRADAVLSTVSAAVLARLLPVGALPGRLHRRLRIWRYGTAPFVMHYALSGPVPWTASEPRQAAVVHVAGELEELSEAAQQSQLGRVPDRPALVVGQHSLHDASRAPTGCHTLYVYAHVPSRYEEPDELVADRIHSQIERFAPGFSSRVLARGHRSPRDTERENPSLVGGDLAGGSMEIDQQLVFRPAPRLCRYRTPLRCFYMAGASVHPGPAVHGVSGRGAAEALLRDQRLRPWRR